MGTPQGTRVLCGSFSDPKRSFPIDASFGSFEYRATDPLFFPWEEYGGLFFPQEDLGYPRGGLRGEGGMKTFLYKLPLL